MKLTKKIALITGLLIMLTILYRWWDDKNLLKSGETKEYRLDKGSTIVIKLHHNGSTGYRNCWINKAKCNSVVLTRRSYRRSFNQIMGYIGSGGCEYLTFKALHKGIDTIKIAICPPEQYKTCQDYKEDSTTADIKVIFVVK